MERVRKYWPYLVVSLAIFWQFRAPLFGRVFWFEDIVAYFEPLWTAAARAMRHGSFPSWDLGAWSGQPLDGDPQIGSFYPPNWIWLAMHPLRAYAWLSLFHALIGAAGMGALIRARGRSREAAALGALSLGLSAFMVLELRHAMFLASTAWLPWVLWGVEKYSRDKRLERLVASSGALGLAILAGGWSMLFWGALVIAVYSVRNLKFLVAAGGIAVGLAAVQLFPAISHARLSPRALGLTWEEASSYAWPSLKYLVTLFVPTWFGTGDHYVGAPDQWELCGYAVGCVTGILALVSLLRSDREKYLFLLIGAAVWLAFGHHFLWAHLPFFSSMRCPARSLFIWTLVAPILGADGLDYLQSKKKWLGNLLLIALAAELLFTWRNENPSVTLAETQARPAAVKWLRENAHPGRIVNDVHLGQRWHNMGLSLGVESAGGYSSLPIWRYLHFLWINNHQKPYPHARIAQDLTAQGIWKFSSPLVDLLNVTWLLASPEHPPDGSGWVRVFHSELDIWRNTETLPRAFVVYETHVLPKDEDQAAALPSLHPEAEAIVDRELGIHHLRPMTPLFALYRDSPFDLIVEVNAEAKGVLVFSEIWHPGWKVLVDDKPAELLRVDYALRGVVVEPGKHTVAMMLEDDPLAYGGAISLTALVLLIGLLLLARKRTRLTSFSPE